MACWVLAAFLGNAWTAPNMLRLQRRGSAAAEFDDVVYEDRSSRAPVYYGARVGRCLHGMRWLSIEGEFIHVKTYADSSRLGAPMPHFAMSHGLNLLLINVGLRTPLNESPVTIVARGGAGPALPHGESTIAGESREQYEYGGLGVHGAGGVEVRLHSRISAVVEYKITYARPEITIAGGTGRTSALTHHLAFGLAFGLSR